MINCAQSQLCVIHVEIEIFVSSKVESLLYVMTGFCTYFKIGKTCLLNFGPNTVRTDFSAFSKVSFIAEQDQNSFFLFIVVAEVEPLVKILERLLVLVRGKITGKVEDDKGYEGVFEVAGNEGSKALLPGSVPKLHAEDIVAKVKVLGHEVDAYGWLSYLVSTPRPYSNLSWMKRIRMEVFPVDCSPRNTTFILLLIWAKEDSDFFSCI